MASLRTVKSRDGLHILGLMLLLFVLASCSNGEVYHRFKQIDHGKWSRDSVFVFLVDSALLLQGESYYISIELSTNQRYPYQDLWLRVEQDLIDTLLQNDTLHIAVVDKRGKWLGSGVGGLHQLSIPYLSGVKPTVHGASSGYQIKIGHYMDDNPLTGVEKIGIKFVESTKTEPMH